MSLKLIPLEPTAHGTQGKKQKNFNPGQKIHPNRTGNGRPGKSPESGLKSICLRLIRFINRGSRFTYEQIDDLILHLERSILNLRKKKQDMMKKRENQ